MKEYIKKLFTFENTFENKIEFDLKDDQIQKIVDATFEKFKSHLADSMCFMCKKPMHGYRVGWREHLFCSEECHKEYARVIDKPDQDYKIMKGDKVLENI